MQKPEVLTTLGRFNGNYPKLLNNKHLILNKDGQFTPAKGGQNHWLFHSKPRGVNYYQNLGSAYHKVGQFKKEKRLYRKAKRDFPGSPLIVYNQAILALTEGDVVAANRYIEKYVSILKDNSWPEAAIENRLAGIYSEAGTLDKAEEYYRKAASLEPSYSYNFARFLIDKERNVNEGLEIINKILDLDPNNYWYLNWKGWAFYKQGKYKEALELLQKSDSLKSIFTPTLYFHLEEVKKALAGQK